MNARKFYALFFCGVLIVVNFISLLVSVQAQTDDNRRAIDLMIVIDNSGSMFAPDVNNPDADGNDPDFLRITGASLFIARLGFSEPNEGDYQAGIVNLGSPSKLVESLQPVNIRARDTLSAGIQNPKPDSYTEFISALQIAYRELQESPNRNPNNLPAVVLITDGRPTSPDKADQTDEQIRQLIEEHSDIPLFIMLLQNPDNPDPDEFKTYKAYLDFWQNMQTTHTHVFAYRVEDATQIEQTYNQIIGELQDTIPGIDGVSLEPGIPLDIFVSKYVQKIILTVIHENGTTIDKGKISIFDPTKTEIVEDDLGIFHFKGSENPIEVFSITAPRLDDTLKEKNWTIISENPVRVFLDRRGSYHINFLTPSVNLTEVNNHYLASGRYSPRRELVIKFDLRDTSGNVIKEPQVVQGSYILPDRYEDYLQDIKFVSDGIYEVRFDLAAMYPLINEKPGRFTFIINAGQADPNVASNIPIARARLFVDGGRGPYIADINPPSLICETGKPSELKIMIGDADLIDPASVSVRVMGAGAEATLNPSATNAVSGDVSALCQAVLAAQTCSTEAGVIFQLRLSAQMKDYSPMIPSEQSIPVKVMAPPCTPTPTPIPPTATPTPTPLPTLIPDTDGDGFNDLDDDCIPEPAWPGLAMFYGCPPDPWMIIVTGIVLAVLAVLFGIYGLPWIMVNTFAPPPDAGYILICRDGENRPIGPKLVKQAGLDKRTSRVTIGSSKKDTICVPGLANQYEVVASGQKYAPPKQRPASPGTRGMPSTPSGRKPSAASADMNVTTYNLKKVNGGPVATFGEKPIKAPKDGDITIIVCSNNKDLHC